MVPRKCNTTQLNPESQMQRYSMLTKRLYNSFSCSTRSKISKYLESVEFLGLGYPEANNISLRKIISLWVIKADHLPCS